MASTKLKLSVIIVSFNTKALLANCLESLFDRQPKNVAENFSESDFEVIVVDNASVDGSVKMIRQTFPQVKLKVNKTNVGFARANNQAIRKSIGQVVALLNSDTLPNQQMLSRVSSYLSSRQNVGAASPTLIYENGLIQSNGGFLPNLFNVWMWMWFIDDLPIVNQLVRPYHQTNTSFYTKTRSLGWISGAGLFIKKQVMDKVGLLDESIFMYGEDVDWCWRINRAGYKTINYSGAKLIHLEHGSGSKKSAIMGEYKGLFYVIKKHCPAWQVGIYKFLLASGAIIRLAIYQYIYPNDDKKTAYQQALKTLR